MFIQPATASAGAQERLYNKPGWSLLTSPIADGTIPVLNIPCSGEFSNVKGIKGICPARQRA